MLIPKSFSIHLLIRTILILIRDKNALQENLLYQQILKDTNMSESSIIESLMHLISKSIEIPVGLEDALISISDSRQLKKGDLILKSGEPVEKTYFIIEGCVRSFLTDRSGKEHTIQFATKNWWISDYRAYFSNKTASLNIECIANAHVIEMNWSDLDRIYKRFPTIESFQKSNLEKHLVSLNTRIQSQLELGAEDRYLKFMTDFPEVAEFAQNNHIASYLGISPQSLSRLKSKLN